MSAKKKKQKSTISKDKLFDKKKLSSWKKIQQKFFSFPLKMLGVAAAIIIIGIACAYLHKVWQNKKNQDTLFQLMDKAWELERVNKWKDAIEIYQQCRILSQDEETTKRLLKFEDRLLKLEKIAKDFVNLYEKGEMAEYVQNYEETLEHLQKANQLYLAEEKILRRLDHVKEMVGSLSEKIEKAKENHELLVNKTLPFHELYKQAERAFRERKWKEAYESYKKAYELDINVNNVLLERKLKDSEEKYKQEEKELFEDSQKSKGLLFYEGKWITIEEKKLLEGFRKYQDKWVNFALYKKLDFEHRNAEERIHSLKKILYEKRTSFSKVYLMETKEGKDFRGEILKETPDFLEMKVLYKKGFVERKFPRDTITRLRLENPTVDEFLKKEEKAKKLSDYVLLLKWAEENKLEEAIELTKCQIFLIDFTYFPQAHIPFYQREGMWLLDE